MSLKRPKIYFSTQMVSPGKVPQGLDKFFLRYSMPGNTQAGLLHLLKLEHLRLEYYLRRRDSDALWFVHSKNSEKQNKSNDTTVSHILRWMALEKVEGACQIIGSELRSRAYDKCVIFALSKSVMDATSIFLNPFRPACVYAGSNPQRVESVHRMFLNGKKKILILNIQAGFGLNLDCVQHAFFMEEHMKTKTNMKALEQLFGPNQKPEIYLRNFCTTDPVCKRLSELVRDHIMAWNNRYCADMPELPEEFI